MLVTAVRDEGALRMWVCRLPVHIDPAGCTDFTEILGEFVTSHWASYPVGADDSVRPQDAPLFTGICGESVTSQRAGRVAGPYRTSANPYCPANFDCKADLPQQFKRNYLQIRCTVTGGAYHSARRVSPCVRNDKKTVLTETAPAVCTKRTLAPFSPLSFPAQGKR